MFDIFENILYIIISLLCLILIIRSFYNNNRITKSYKAKYGKPLYIFKRICLLTEKDYEFYKQIYVYPNFVITKYSGDDLILPKGAIVEVEKHAFLKALFKQVEFKASTEHKDYKIYVCSCKAVKILEQFFNVYKT